MLGVVAWSGWRMIAQGSDGLSRGNMIEGVMKGKAMLEFVPLNKSAIQVHTELEEWIKSWLTDGQQAAVLTPED